MIRIFLLFVTLLLQAIKVNGQTYRGYNGKRSNRSIHWQPKHAWVGYTALGAGQENLISFGKMGGLVNFPMNRRATVNQNHFFPYAVYVGAEGSILVFFAGVVSISGNTGIKIGPISTDISLTRLWLANPDGDVVGSQTTYNPKLGVIFGPIWLKAGPSFRISDQNLFGNFLKIGNTHMNFEFIYNIAW